MKLAASIFAILIATGANAQKFEKCAIGQKRSATETCVVDGDTLWIDGVKIRLMGFDTPEPMTNRCHTDMEAELASKATSRLIELLNNNQWSIEYFGVDSTQEKRRLATISINGVDVGDTLQGEHLARSWPDGDKWWCD